ncbi:MAG: amino acid ABC transporter permease [Desulfovibrio sp.]|jgi:L-cystine transport system permease protein|nr:amino acid ABC transporter permease [Desulfovibrio sp.]
MNTWFSLEEMVRYIPILLEFLPVTLKIFINAVLIGCVGGSLMAMARIYRVPVARLFAVVFVSYTRGTPVLVQLMIAYYIFPLFLESLYLPVNGLPPIFFVIAAYGLYMSANISEILRGAAAAIPRGQIEAAFALGMSNVQILRRVIAPQAFAIALPDFGTILLVGLKSTSLAFSVGVMDMVGRGQALGGQTMRNFEVFVALSIIYYAMTLLLESGIRWLERHFHRTGPA